MKRTKNKSTEKSPFTLITKGPRTHTVMVKNLNEALLAWNVDRVYKMTKGCYCIK